MKMRLDGRLEGSSAAPAHLKKIFFLAMVGMMVFVLAQTVLADLFLQSRSGNIYFNTSSSSRLQVTAGGNLLVLGQGNLSLPANLTVDTNTLVVDSVNNRVGIGTTTPLEALYVVGKINATVDLCIQGGTCLSEAGTGSGDITAVGSMVSGDAFVDANADDDWLVLGASAGRIEFDDQGTDEVNILNAKVGIGSSVPLSLLYINDTQDVFSTFTIQNNDSATPLITINASEDEILFYGKYVQLEPDAFKIGNYTALEAAAFNEGNFTSFATTNGYLSTSNATAIGVLIQNSTINRSIDLSSYAATSDLSSYQLEANAFKVANFTSTAISNGYLSTSNATAIGSLIQNSTINRSISLDSYVKTNSDATFNTVTVNRNLYIIGNISNVNVYNLNVNGSLHPALSATFDIGNGTSQWRNGNFSGTVQATILSDAAGASITGGVVNAPTVQVSGQNVQVEGSAWKLANATAINDTVTGALALKQEEGAAFKFANFSSSLSTVNSSIAAWNATSSAIYPRSLSVSIGVGTSSPTQKLEVAGNILVNNTASAMVNLSGPLMVKSGNDMIISD